MKGRYVGRATTASPRGLSSQLVKATWQGRQAPLGTDGVSVVCLVVLADSAYAILLMSLATGSSSR